MSEPLSLMSAVKEVHLYRAGAIVRRHAVIKETALGEGGTWPREVCVTGLPLTMQDESVRVWLEGPERAALPVPADVRVQLVLPAIGASLITPSEAQIAAADFAAKRLTERLARIDFEIEQLGTVALALPAPFKDQPPKPAPVGTWIDATTFVAAEKKRLVTERAEVVRALETAEEERQRLRRQAYAARAAQDALGDAISKRVVLSLRGGTATATAAGWPVVVAIEYRVVGARWAPAYVFRMRQDGTKAELSQRALVVQRTGEPWNQVRLSLSTADLAQETRLPELHSLRLGRRQAPAAAIAWREPPQGVDALFSGLDLFLASSGRPAGARLAPAHAPPLLSAGETSLSQEAIRFQATRTAQAPEPPLPAPTPKHAFAPPQEAVGFAPEEPVCDSAPSAGATVDELLADIEEEVEEETPRLAKSKRAARRSSARAAAPTAPARVYSAAPAAMPQPAPIMPRPAPAMAASAAAASFGGPPPGAQMLGGPPLGGGGAWQPVEEEVVSLADADVGGAAGNEALRYGRLVMVDWQDADRRGHLRPATLIDEVPDTSRPRLEALAKRLLDAEVDSRRVGRAAFPVGYQPFETSCGSYDYRYDAEGLVDVPSDGVIHNVPIASREAAVESTLVVVPRVSPQAVRVASIKNPLRGPLLAGPADVYLADEFLVTTPIRSVPVDGELTVGLGVEEALKTARNCSFEEDKAGLLRGGSLLRHRVDIEVASRLAYTASIEVRDRLPIKEEGDDEVDINLARVEPPWAPYEQLEGQPLKGGKRWRFQLAPGESKKLSFTYEIKISAKNELIGGNRRES